MQSKAPILTIKLLLIAFAGVIAGCNHNHSKKIESSLLLSYEKLVERQRNGLAVVKVKRGACGGCFNVVPPQRQAEIKEKKKIILCEYCGRILADVIVEVVEDKPKKRTKRKTSTKKKATAKK